MVTIVGGPRQLSAVALTAIAVQSPIAAAAQYA
jgi:hypothetical protein